MNTKRQTIWLVSMLSLMVVLSAYYLFTEEPAKPETAGVAAVKNAAGEAVGANELPKVEYTQVSNGLAEPNVTAPQETTEPAGKQEPAAKEDATTPVDAATGANKGTLTDKEKAVLDKVQAEGVMSRSSIEQKSMERSEKYQQQFESLLTKINSTKISSEEMTKLYNEMEKLEEKEQKITALEAELQKDYPNVVISEENNNVKVIVQAEKMEARQAVDIIDRIIKELQVTQDRVSVQYVTE